MEEVAGVAVADLGLSGLISIGVLMIMGGALIPRSMHKAVTSLMQQRIDKLEELLGKRDDQIDRLLSSAETSAESLEKIQSATDPERRGGER